MHVKFISLHSAIRVLICNTLPSLSEITYHSPLPGGHSVVSENKTRFINSSLYPLADRPLWTALKQLQAETENGVGYIKELIIITVSRRFHFHYGGEVCSKWKDKTIVYKTKRENYIVGNVDIWPSVGMGASTILTILDPGVCQACVHEGLQNLLVL